MIRRFIADRLFSWAYTLVAGRHHFACTLVAARTHPENPNVVWVIVGTRGDLRAELEQLRILAGAFATHYDQREALMGTNG